MVVALAWFVYITSISGASVSVIDATVYNRVPSPIIAIGCSLGSGSKKFGIHFVEASTSLFCRVCKST